MLPANELVRTDGGVNPFPALVSIMRAIGHGWEIAYTQWSNNVTMMRKVVGNTYYWIQVNQYGKVTRGIPEIPRGRLLNTLKSLPNTWITISQRSKFIEKKMF